MRLALYCPGAIAAVAALVSVTVKASPSATPVCERFPPRPRIAKRSVHEVAGYSVFSTENLTVSLAVNRLGTPDVVSTGIARFSHPQGAVSILRVSVQRQELTNDDRRRAGFTTFFGFSTGSLICS